MRAMLLAFSLALLPLSACTEDNPNAPAWLMSCFHAGHEADWGTACPEPADMTTPPPADLIAADLTPACVPLQSGEGPCGCEGMSCCLGACNAGMRCGGNGRCALPAPPDMSPPRDMIPPPGTIGGACKTAADCDADAGVAVRCQDNGPEYGFRCCYQPLPNWSWTCQPW